MFKILVSLCFLILAGVQPALSSDTADAVNALKKGGYAIVFRHTATDDSQKDITPFRFDDMKSQRQLSDKGRDAAKAIGAALKDLGIPIGDVFTSQLNRAIETAKLMAGKEGTPKPELTDSSAGSTSGMANPDGTNAKAGLAVRNLLKAGGSTNTVYVTHKTNITDAFGKTYSDIGEGEALIVSVDKSGPMVKARIKPTEWTAPRG